VAKLAESCRGNVAAGGRFSNVFMTMFNNTVGRSKYVVSSGWWVNELLAERIWKKMVVS
jgi:hypothetical protein